MYPHRLVIDANCVNARGRMQAMASLEQYHHAGALELIVTSTLPVELGRGSLQAQKIQTYQSIGGHLFYLLGDGGVQSSSGAPVRASLLNELVRHLFGWQLRGPVLVRALRDCLHLDQAQMNAADMFVTNDRRLKAAEPFLAAKQVDLIVCSPEDALDHVMGYFRRTIGSSELEHTRIASAKQLPVIIGSNSFGSCSFAVGQSNQERLLAITLTDGLLHLDGRFRDRDGQLLVELTSGKPPEIHGSGVTVTCVGSGPIAIGDGHWSAAVVTNDRGASLAVRMTHTNRAVVYRMQLRDCRGDLVAAVQRGALSLQGVSVTC